ncbi:MAG: hypothetical protein ACYC96_12470 [Fimbriimonadaceae bacterium]
MIPWITAVPADPADPPSGSLSDAFDDPAPGNQYLTKRDAKWILFGLLLLAAILYPVWLKLKEGRDRYDCGQNMKAISTAMSSYLADNDDRFPPTYVPQPDAIYPRVDAKGRPYTWASTLVGLSGFDPTKRSFNCPSADPSETMNAEGIADANLPMSYGMYEAYDTADQSKVPSAGSSVLITETSNDGARNTYDPHPMPPSMGSVHDGFLIGWSTGDFVPPPPGTAPPVTRVAVPDSKGGLTRALFRGGRIPQGRHDDEIYVMFVDGHYELMKVGYLLNSQVWDIPGR